MTGVNLDQKTLLERILRHLGCFLCRPQQLEDDDRSDLITMDHDDDDDDDDGGGDSDSALDHPRPSIHFPIHEVLMMTNRRQQLQENLHYSMGIIERPPLAGGVVKRIELMGIFPTCRWMGDVTMPPDVKEFFGGTPFFPLGEYRVATIDIVDATRTHHSLTLIVNSGVEGLLTGYWGAAFAANPPHSCWARFETTGTHQTTVREEPMELPLTTEASRAMFQDFDCLEFCDEYFTAGFAPGTCQTQIERILGLTAEFLLEIEWKDWLPETMLEVRDTLSKLERKRRAQQSNLQPADLHPTDA